MLTTNLNLNIFKSLIFIEIIFKFICFYFSQEMNKINLNFSFENKFKKIYSLKYDKFIDTIKYFIKKYIIDDNK